MGTTINFVKSFFTKHPFVSNSIIYGTLYVGAEFSQQTITRKFLTDPPRPLDKETLSRYAVMGTFVFPPILYNWYKWLDKAFPGNTKKIVVKKLILDQFVLTPPLLGIFFTGMSLLEGAKYPFEELQEKFPATFARSCLFWLPAQSMNFLFVPAKFRILYVGSCTLVWVNILCWIKRQDYKKNLENST